MVPQMAVKSESPHLIHALFDSNTVRVYQAYNNEIADLALAAGRFVSPPFKLDRMTWIKPSFLWMMYRSGWGKKESGQSRILALDLSRDGFEWALSHSVPSRMDPTMSAGEWKARLAHFPVRIQWDPDRDLLLRALPRKAIQIGLGKEAVEAYVNHWICRITDVTSFAHQLHSLVQGGQFQIATDLLPKEEIYPFPI